MFRNLSMRGWHRLLVHNWTVLRELDWRTRWLIVEAVPGLAFSRLAVLVLPFRWIAIVLGPVNQETSNTGKIVDEDLARLGTVVTSVSRHTPWNSNCLAQAITGKLMLRRRGLPSTLYMGVFKEGTTMEAHAWLRCGDQVLLGDHRLERYTVVVCYGDDEK